MFTRAIVSPPAPNFAAGLTTAGRGAPLFARALQQHEAYCAALEACGLTLTRLEADADYPDSTFVEDTAILAIGVAPSPTVGFLPRWQPAAVLTRPGPQSRRGEVTAIQNALESFFPASAIETIKAPGTVDGGDICQAANHFFVGVSERTNEAGAQQLAEILARFGFTASLIDIRPNRTTKSVSGASATASLLHLKSGLAYLSDNRLVVTEALAKRAEFSAYELISVRPEEEYAANCINVNDNILVPAGFPATERAIQRLGYQTIVLEMSEFQKMDGGLSCLSLRF